MRLFFIDYRFEGDEKSNGKGVSQRTEQLRKQKA
jgi:hypothetical protein